MSRYLRLMLMFLFIQACVFAVLMVLNSSYETTYLAAVADKSDLLRSAPSPRIVLVGDSGLAFGMDSSRLREDLRGEYYPVNMGLHGGLGLSFELEQTLAGARAGDQIVLCPAYDTILVDTTELPTIWSALRVQPGAWSYLTNRQRLKLLQQLIPQNHPLIMSHDMAVILYNRIRAATTDRLRALIYSALGTTGYLVTTEDTSTYSRLGFNEYGDQTRAWGAPTQYQGAPYDYEFNPEAVAKSVGMMQDFIEECRLKGMEVVFCYPTIPADMYERSKEVINRLAMTLESELPIAFINDPADEVRPTTEFFDTIHHLRGPAVQDRADRLARYLGPYLP